MLFQKFRNSDCFSVHFLIFLELFKKRNEPLIQELLKIAK